MNMSDKPDIYKMSDIRKILNVEHSTVKKRALQKIKEGKMVRGEHYLVDANNVIYFTDIGKEGMMSTPNPVGRPKKELEIKKEVESLIGEFVSNWQEGDSNELHLGLSIFGVLGTKKSQEVGDKICDMISDIDIVDHLSITNVGIVILTIDPYVLEKEWELKKKEWDKQSQQESEDYWRTRI